jgi:hypothetical protein
LGFNILTWLNELLKITILAARKILGLKIWDPIPPGIEYIPHLQVGLM